jgi:hypothetical protein
MCICMLELIENVGWRKVLPVYLINDRENRRGKIKNWKSRENRKHCAHDTERRQAKFQGIPFKRLAAT